jgi:hypothetical protein
VEGDTSLRGLKTKAVGVPSPPESPPSSARSLEELSTHHQLNYRSTPICLFCHIIALPAYGHLGTGVSLPLSRLAKRHRIRLHAILMGNFLLRLRCNHVNGTRYTHEGRGEPIAFLSFFTWHRCSWNQYGSSGRNFFKKNMHYETRFLDTTRYDNFNCIMSTI